MLNLRRIVSDVDSEIHLPSLSLHVSLHASRLDVCTIARSSSVLRLLLRPIDSFSNYFQLQHIAYHNFRVCALLLSSKSRPSPIITSRSKPHSWFCRCTPVGWKVPPDAYGAAYFVTFLSIWKSSFVNMTIITNW